MSKISPLPSYLPLVCLLLSLAAGAQQNSPKPEPSRFTRQVLDDDLNEPMELAVAADGTVYYVERPGLVNRLDPRTGTKTRLAKLPVRFLAEDGLMGIALDPGFAANGLVYLYFGDPVAEGETYFNVLARFQVSGDSLRQASRKDLLRIPVTHEGVSHSAGSMTFDRQGNLYLSTGDNTNPFESDGYSPSDDQPGRARFDALRSAGNTNDLRGKILRIHPEPDGTYTVPAGNLFPPGTAGARPEIYVMGCRNPYRIHVDARSNVLYWGEVGPDAGTDSLGRGPRGYDEFNRADRAGNYGWPLVIGNGKPYHYFDFAAKRSGEAVDPQRPLNRSANNTGLKELPPARPATMWYPYDDSPEFPQLGKGGRNAIGGPVYYAGDHQNTGYRFPSYYDGKWFIADWMRNWIFTATLDPAGNVAELEPFLPAQPFSKPIDLAFGPDGALYVLEYGAYWRAKNTDAKLIRIEYTEGNRAPVARITADRTRGAAPLKVRFSAKGSFDHDRGDSLRYEWRFTGTTVQARGSAATFSFPKPGEYPASVTVTDPQGKSAVARLTVRVGNEPPKVAIKVQGNRSFYFDDKPVPYQVQVTDREDGTLGKTIPAGQVNVSFQHLPAGYDFAGLEASQEVKPRGLLLMESSDCLACHAKEKQSVGPSFVAVSRRYDTTAVAALAGKIIQGGGGVWGTDHVMSAHPQLNAEEASEMVRYILSLKEEAPRMKPQGTVRADRPEGTYLLSARYTDRGGLEERATLYLRPPRIRAQQASAMQGVALRNLNGKEAIMAYNEPGAWLAFRRLDLTGIKTIAAQVHSPGLLGVIEVRTGSPTGPLIGALPVREGPPREQDVATPITPTAGEHDVYFVYKETEGDVNIWKRLEVPWFEFSREAGKAH